MNSGQVEFLLHQRNKCERYIQIHSYCMIQGSLCDWSNDDGQSQIDILLFSMEIFLWQLQIGNINIREGWLCQIIKLYCIYEGGARYKWLYFMQSPIQPEMKYNHFYHTILPNITLLYVKRAIPNAYLVLCEECWVVLLGIS